MAIVLILCGLAGFSDGINDCVVSLRFYNSKFWGVNWYKNKEKYGWLRREVLTFTCDGWHFTKFCTPVLYTVAVIVAISNRVYDYPLITGIAQFAAFRAGWFMAYNVIFKKKDSPKA